MPVQAGGGKTSEPKGRVDLAPTAIAEEGRASSKKNRRRRKKTAAAATAAAAAVAAPSPAPVGAMQRLFDTSKEVFADSSPGFVPPPDAVARLAGLLSTYPALMAAPYFLLGTLVVLVLVSSMCNYAWCFLFEGKCNYACFFFKKKITMHGF